MIIAIHIIQRLNEESKIICVCAILYVDTNPMLWGKMEDNCNWTTVQKLKKKPNGSTYY